MIKIMIEFGVFFAGKIAGLSGLVFLAYTLIRSKKQLSHKHIKIIYSTKYDRLTFGSQAAGGIATWKIFLNWLRPKASVIATMLFPMPVGYSFWHWSVSWLLALFSISLATWPYVCFSAGSVEFTTASAWHNGKKRILLTELAFSKQFSHNR